MKLPLVFLVLLTARIVFIAMVIICLNLIFLCIQIALVEKKQFNLSLAESHITYWINCIELRIYIILLLQLSYVPTFFCLAAPRQGYSGDAGAWQHFLQPGSVWSHLILRLHLPADLAVQWVESCYITAWLWFLQVITLISHKYINSVSSLRPHKESISTMHEVNSMARTLMRVFQNYTCCSYLLTSIVWQGLWCVFQILTCSYYLLTSIEWQGLWCLYSRITHVLTIYCVFQNHTCCYFFLCITESLIFLLFVVYTCVDSFPNWSVCLGSNLLNLHF